MDLKFFLPRSKIKSLIAAGNLTHGLKRVRALIKVTKIKFLRLHHVTIFDFGKKSLYELFTVVDTVNFKLTLISWLLI